VEKRTSQQSVGPSPEVVTFGETMAVFAPTTREPMRDALEFRLRVAGAESNVAIGLARLGHSAGWMSLLGNDELGLAILHRIRGEGVDTSRTKLIEGGRTGVMFKDAYGQDTRVFYYRDGSAASQMGPQDLDLPYIAGAKILHITGISPALGDSVALAVEQSIAFAQANGVLVSFDPNIRRKLWGNRDLSGLMENLLLRADIVLLGKDEAKALLGVDEPDQVFAALFTRGRARWIALKDGAKGSDVAVPGRSLFSPPHACSPVDSVGAGDAYDAGFLAGILSNRSLETCGTMGGIMGAMATQTLGDFEGVPDAAAMQRILAGSQEITR